MNENLEKLAASAYMKTTAVWAGLKNRYDVLWSDQEVHGFLAKMWDAQPGTLVLQPSWMVVNDANELCSVLLAFKEQQKRAATPVQIRKVAEIRGSRFNTGKLRMDLIDPLAMEGLASVLTKGAVKYNAHNWRDGLPYTETIASLLRHTFAVLRGEDIDPETGEYHADHMQCNTMFLSNMMKTRKDMDDRWTPKYPVDDAS